MPTCAPCVARQVDTKRKYEDIGDIPKPCVEEDEEVAKLLHMQLQLLDRQRDAFHDRIMRFHTAAIGKVAVHCAHIDAAAVAKDVAQGRWQKARADRDHAHRCLGQADISRVAALEVAELLHNVLTMMLSFIADVEAGGTVPAAPMSSTDAAGSMMRLLVDGVHSQMMHCQAVQASDAAGAAEAHVSACLSENALQQALQRVAECEHLAVESRGTSAAVTMALHEVVTMMEG